MLGSLLSAHLLILDESEPFGDLTPTDYSGELLERARDLALRLLPAFHGTTTGIPHPRVRGEGREGREGGGGGREGEEKEKGRVYMMLYIVS